jgi:hypothetical protein
MDSPESKTPAASGEPAATQPSHPGAALSPEGIAPESDVRTHSPGAAAPLSGAGHDGGSGDLGEPGVLPQGYGDGRLVCLVRDPSCAYIYWDLSQQQVEQAFGGLGAARAALKLWSLKGELVREVEVHLESRGWYVRDLVPGSELRVELWAQGEHGARLLRAARPLRLPPAIPSDDLDLEYLEVPAWQQLGSLKQEKRAHAASASSLATSTEPIAPAHEGALPWSGTHAEAAHLAAAAAEKTPGKQ